MRMLKWTVPAFLVFTSFSTAFADLYSPSGCKPMDLDVPANSLCSKPAGSCYGPIAESCAASLPGVKSVCVSSPTTQTKSKEKVNSFPILSNGLVDINPTQYKKDRNASDKQVYNKMASFQMAGKTYYCPASDEHTISQEFYIYGAHCIASDGTPAPVGDSIACNFTDKYLTLKQTECLADKNCTPNVAVTDAGVAPGAAVTQKAAGSQPVTESGIYSDSANK